jgi:hypothetical protein
MTTNLACWTLGPAYYQNLEETNPECFVCSEPISGEAFCQGCGSGICAEHTTEIHHVAHCSWCASDAKRGGR